MTGYRHGPPTTYFEKRKIIDPFSFLEESLDVVSSTLFRLLHGHQKVHTKVEHSSLSLIHDLWY